MELPFETTLESLNDTISLAKDFSEKITEGNIIVLNGNLGTGKTTLVKEICKNYSILDVNSPSFSIVNEYQGEKKIYHFDFYRLKRIEELYDIGFEEYLNNTEAIIFIEWANLFPEILPSSYFEVQLSFNKEKSRKIKIRKK